MNSSAKAIYLRLLTQHKTHQPSTSGIIRNFVPILTLSSEKDSRITSSSYKYRSTTLPTSNNYGNTHKQHLRRLRLSPPMLDIINSTEYGSPQQSQIVECMDIDPTSPITSAKLRFFNLEVCHVPHAAFARSIQN